MTAQVLIVDDDEAFRRVAAVMIADSGHSVIGEAQTLAEARSAIQALHPDAVLLDVHLPDGDGLRLAADLAAEGTPPRVLLTSTDPGAASPATVQSTGAAGFVPKTDLAMVDLGSYLRP